MRTALIATAAIVGVVAIAGCSGGGKPSPTLPPAWSKAIDRTLAAKSLEVVAVTGASGKGIDTESIYNKPDRVAIVTAAGQTIIDIGNTSYLSASSGLPGQTASTANDWLETKPRGLKQLVQTEVFGPLRVAAEATSVTGAGPTYTFVAPGARGTVTTGGGWVTSLVVTTNVTTTLTYSTFDAAPPIGAPVSQITVLPAAGR